MYNIIVGIVFIIDVFIVQGKKFEGEIGVVSYLIFMTWGTGDLPDMYICPKLEDYRPEWSGYMHIRQIRSIQVTSNMYHFQHSE